MSSLPPISSHLTLGTSTSRSYIDNGFDSIIAASKCYLLNTVVPSVLSLIAFKCAFLTIYAKSDDTKPLAALAITTKSSSLIDTSVSAGS